MRCDRSQRPKQATQKVSRGISAREATQCPGDPSEGRPPSSSTSVVPTHPREPRDKALLAQSHL